MPDDLVTVYHTIINSAVRFLQRVTETTRRVAAVGNRDLQLGSPRKNASTWMLSGKRLREDWSMLFAGVGDGGGALDALPPALGRILQHGWMEEKQEEPDCAAQSSSQVAKTRSKVR